MIQMVCTKRGPWRIVRNGEGPCAGPKFNEVVTVTAAFDQGPDVFLVLKEHHSFFGFHEKWFQPLVSDDELKKALKTESEMAEA